MSRFLSPRFGAEAAFLIAVAAVLYLLEASRPAIVAGMFAAWIAVAVFEVVASRDGRDRAPLEDEAAPAEPPVEEAPAVRVLPAGEEAELYVTPAAEAAPQTAPSAPEKPLIVPEPAATAATGPPAPPKEAVADEPEPEPVAAAAALDEPEPEPAPELEEALIPPPPPPVLAPVAAPPEPEPEPEPVAEPEPEQPVVELRPGAPREWNLWELERLSREHAGEDPVRNEERSYLLMYLRDFATADGMLPSDFDPLVRESFGDLLAAGR